MLKPYSFISHRINVGFLFTAVLLISSLNGLSQKIELKGKVIDYETKTPMAGVSVFIPSIHKGTATDKEGLFSFSLKVDAYDLVLSYTGYKTLTQPVYILDTNYIVVELRKKPPDELAEVIVESRKKDANVSDARMSTININPALLKKTPLVLGEADILKALTLQTGITTIGEGAGGFSVRGGFADQNLVLIDGAPLFNTSHLLGFYSTLSPEAIQDFTVYKGAIPASYGGRLSSLVALNIRPGNENRVNTMVSVNPISLHFFSEGPIKNSKLTFSVGGRIADPTWLMNQISTLNGNSAYYYDVVGKLVYHFDAHNQVGVSFYRSYDHYKFQGDTSYAWQTNIVTLNGRSDFSKKLSLYYNVNSTYYASDINGLQPNYEFRLRNTIQTTEAKASLHYQAADRIYFEGGYDFIHYVVNPGELLPTQSHSSINPMNLQNELGDESAAFLLGRFDITKTITLEAGIRHSVFLNKGPQTIYQYADGVPASKETITDSIVYPKGATVQRYQGWEPRLLLKIGLNESTSIKMSYSRTNQYLQLISNTVAITPVDYWKLADPLVKPALADQVAAGIFKNFRDDAIETSVEGFYKTMQNLVDYKNGAQLNMNPYLDADLLSASGKSYGVEFNVRKPKGKTTWQLAYTWSRSLIRDNTDFASEQVNGGAYYPSEYDRPFNLALTGGTQIGQGWTFGWTFVYITGRPDTYPDGTYVINNSIVANYSTRNADRLPDYNRLDISFTHDSRRTADQKKYTIINFSLYNVYGRKNPYSIYFQNTDGVLNAYELSVLGTIVPSVTLTFYF
ncbi:MAG TPA: TonB-dependent receptor [Puia sp.]|nr:TonB-dependent receptor [Puia sp.]